MSDRDLIDDLVGENDDHPEDLVPTVEVPKPNPDGDAPDPAVTALFWRLVAVFNVALFGVTVGPMVLYFQGNPRIGGGLLTIGLLFAGYGLVRYWAFKRDRLAD